MKRVDDFRLRFGNKEYVPIMVGGMGVDISTSELALEAARLGGIGHISDAMVEDVSDRRFDTTFVKDKTKLRSKINNCLGFGKIELFQFFQGFRMLLKIV